MVVVVHPHVDLFLLTRDVAAVHRYVPLGWYYTRDSKCAEIIGEDELLYAAQAIRPYSYLVHDIANSEHDRAFRADGKSNRNITRRDFGYVSGFHNACRHYDLTLQMTSVLPSCIPILPG